jgi:hypothetical protein
LAARDDAEIVIAGIFDINRRLGDIARKRSATFSKRTMEKKDQPKRPLTAEDLLAMDADEVHEWASRKLAERLAELERKSADEEAQRESATS